jgi:hypothetical protein
MSPLGVLATQGLQEEFPTLRAKYPRLEELETLLPCLMRLAGKYPSAGEDPDVVCSLLLTPSPRVTSPETVPEILLTRCSLMAFRKTVAAGHRHKWWRAGLYASDSLKCRVPAAPES